jgi:hypothetical protein
MNSRPDHEQIWSARTCSCRSFAGSCCSSYLTCTVVTELMQSLGYQAMPDARSRTAPQDGELVLGWLRTCEGTTQMSFFLVLLPPAPVGQEVVSTNRRRRASKSERCGGGAVGDVLFVSFPRLIAAGRSRREPQSGGRVLWRLSHPSSRARAAVTNEPHQGVGTCQAREIFLRAGGLRAPLVEAAKLEKW